MFENIVYISVYSSRKKLLFMGQDFAQDDEWNVEKSIDWHLADEFGHRDIMLTLRNLMDIYKKYPVLYSFRNFRMGKPKRLLG